MELIDTKKTISRSKDFVFKIAEKQSEKVKVFELRKKIYEEKLTYLLDRKKKYQASDSYDNYSILCSMEEKGEIIATCRVTPCRDEKWEMQNANLDSFYNEIDSKRYLQLNRVCVDKDYRNKKLHITMFYKFSNWLLTHTKYSNYFAVCNIELVRLYRDMGANLVLDNGFYLDDRNNEKYFLLSGDIANSNKIMKSKLI